MKVENKNIISFESKLTNDDKVKMWVENASPTEKAIFANLPDAFIKKAALSEAYNETSKSRRNTNFISGASMIAWPTADVLCAASAAPATDLAGKTAAGLSRAKDWGIMFGIIALYDKATKALSNKFPSIKKFSEDHPVISTVGNLGLLYLLVSKGTKGVNALLAYAADKFKEKNTFTGLKNWINDLSFAPKVVKSLEKHANKFGIVAFAAFAGLLFSLGKSIFDLMKFKRIANDKMELLDKVRFESARSLENQIEANEAQA